MPLPPNVPSGIALQTPQRIKVAQSVRNGLIPSATFETDLTNSLNFTAGCRTKELFRAHGDITAIPTSAASSRTRWRFAAHTSPLLRKLRVVFYAARQNSGDPIFDPKITLTITDANESTTYGSGSFWFGSASTASPPGDTPSEFGYGEVEISGVPASTTIYGKFTETNCARLVSATVYEESKSLTASNGYVFPQNVSVGAPILDARRQSVYELARDLWTDGAAHLFNWTVEDQSSPRTNATSSPKNVIDLSAMGTGDDARWQLDTRYGGTRARPNTVPCVLAVYAKMSGATQTGGVILGGTDSGDLGGVSVTGTTAKWYTASIDLQAAIDDYYVYFYNLAVTPTETLSVYAVSLFQLA